MNRDAEMTSRHISSVPRTRGDEPSSYLGRYRYEKCSPHTRG